MFISKTEKENIYEELSNLRRNIASSEKLFCKGLDDLMKRISALEHKEAMMRKPASPTSDAAKREYAKAYYWRKKAERLANGSKEKVKPMNSKENHESKAAVNKSV